MSVQVSIRVDESINERADDLVAFISRMRGSEASRASVMKEAIARGLVALEDEKRTYERHLRNQEAFVEARVAAAVDGGKLVVGKRGKAKLEEK